MKLRLGALVLIVVSLFSYQNALAFIEGEGWVSVTTDASSPSYQLVAAGTNNILVSAFKMHANGEPVLLTRLGLKLTQGSALDLIKVSVYNNTTKVGEAYFPAGATSAFVVFSTPVTLPQSADTVLTVRADFSPIGTGQAVTVSGHQVAVDYMNATARGAISGQAALVTGSTSVAGVRVMKSYPTVALDSLPQTTVLDGRLMRFKVSANASGPIGLTQLFVNVAPVNLAVSNVNIYAFTDPNYSQPVSGLSVSGALRSTNACLSGCSINDLANILISDSYGTPSTLQIPAGQTRYFEVRGNVMGSSTPGASVTTKLIGDGSSNFMVNAQSLVGKDAYFVWSPNSTTTATRSAEDWTIGYAVKGLPTAGLVFTRYTPSAPAPACTLVVTSQNNLGKKTLSWTTTNATNLSLESDVIIDSVTPVSAGSMTVYVSESTLFTGIATGPGGTATCSAWALYSQKYPGYIP